jgi:uncharacterized protein YpmB
VKKGEIVAKKKEKLKQKRDSQGKKGACAVSIGLLREGTDSVLGREGGRQDFQIDYTDRNEKGKFFFRGFFPFIQ